MDWIFILQIFDGGVIDGLGGKIDRPLKVVAVTKVHSEEGVEKVKVFGGTIYNYRSNTAKIPYTITHSTISLLRHCKTDLNHYQIQEVKKI